MGDVILSLDLGTTGVRALLFDAAGGVLGQAYQSLPLSYPAADRVEQDATAFSGASLEVMQAALREAGCKGSDLRAVAVVTQRSSALAWDAASGRPLAPVLGWQDRRTLERVNELRALGLPVNTLASCTKFEWLVREVPAVRDAAAQGRLRLGTPDVWLTSWLTGGEAFVTDPSNAGTTGLYDAGSGGWFDAALELFGQDAGWHPEIVASNAVVGVTDPALLGAAVPVAARAGDQQAACYAQGIRQPGDAKLTLGTSAMLDRMSGSTPSQAPPGAYDLPLWRLQRGDGIEDAFCHEGTVITAGAAVEWLQRIGVLPAVEQVDAMAAAGRSGVNFVPALAGLGTPWMADGVRGSFTGLGLHTGAEDLVRAVIDGIAQRCVDLTDALAVGEVLHVDGGLARSRWLLQRMADLGQRQVIPAADLESTARGGAALAASSPDVSGADLPEAAPEQAIEPVLDAGAAMAARQAWQAHLDWVRQQP